MRDSPSFQYIQHLYSFGRDQFEITSNTSTSSIQALLNYNHDENFVPQDQRHDQAHELEASQRFYLHYLKACRKYSAWSEAIVFFQNASVLPTFAEQLVVDTLRDAGRWQLGLRLSVNLHFTKDTIDHSASQVILPDGTIVFPERYQPLPHRCQNHMPLLTSLVRSAGNAHPHTAWSLSMQLLALVLRDSMFGGTAQPLPSAYDSCLLSCMRAGYEYYVHAARVIDFALTSARIGPLLRPSVLRFALEVAEEANHWLTAVRAYAALHKALKSQNGKDDKTAALDACLEDEAELRPHEFQDDHPPELDLHVHEQVIRTLALSQQWWLATALLNQMYKCVIHPHSLSGVHNIPSTHDSGVSLGNSRGRALQVLPALVSLPRSCSKVAVLETLRYLLPIVFSSRLHGCHPRLGLQRLREALRNGMFPSAIPFAVVMEQANRHNAPQIVLAARKSMSEWSIRPCVSCRAQHIIAMVLLKSPLEAIRAYMYVKNEGLASELPRSAIEALVAAGSHLPLHEPLRLALFDDLKAISVYAHSLVEKVHSNSPNELSSSVNQLPINTTSSITSRQRSPTPGREGPDQNIEARESEAISSFERKEKPSPWDSIPSIIETATRMHERSSDFVIEEEEVQLNQSGTERKSSMDRKKKRNRKHKKEKATTVVPSRFSFLSVPN